MNRIFVLLLVNFLGSQETKKFKSKIHTGDKMKYCLPKIIEFKE